MTDSDLPQKAFTNTNRTMKLRLFLFIPLFILTSCVTTINNRVFDYRDVTGRINYYANKKFNNVNLSENEIAISIKKYLSKDFDQEMEKYSAKLFLLGFYTVGYNIRGKYKFGSYSCELNYKYNFVRPINTMVNGNKTILSFGEIINSPYKIKFLSSISTDPFDSGKNFLEFKSDDNSYFVKFDSASGLKSLNIRNMKDIVVSVYDGNEKKIAEIVSRNTILDAYNLFVCTENDFLTIISSTATILYPIFNSL